MEETEKNNIEPRESFSWDASSFFRGLTGRNRLARARGFAFHRVTGLEGMQEAVKGMTRETAFVAVDLDSPGYVELVNSPKTRRVTTVFLFMRHGAQDMEVRDRCLGIMREIFRQFMSVLVMERTRLQQKKIYIDTRISFTEVDRYAFSGGACAYFPVAVDTATDLRYNAEEWEDE